MRLDVAFTPAEVGGFVFDEKTAVVIDVLRATTTMVTACLNGCARIIPVLEPEDAFSAAGSLSLGEGRKDSCLLGGERGAKPIPGFHLGNSPLEYTPEVVGGRSIVMTTTNGTRAFLAAGAAREVLVASFLNLSSVATRCLEVGRDVIVVCAGLRGSTSLEDTACAGALVEKLVSESKVILGDGAFIARLVYSRFSGNIPHLFDTSQHGRYLKGLGLEEDLRYCARIDTTAVVPSGQWAKGMLQIGICKN